MTTILSNRNRVAAAFSLCIAKTGSPVLALAAGVSLLCAMLAVFGKLPADAAFEKSLALLTLATAWLESRLAQHVARHGNQPTSPK